MDTANSGLIGRSSELERLSALAVGARNGHGASLLIRGEPGIGKTALLSAFSRAAHGARLLRADGYEAESEMPYATLQRIGRPLVAHLDSLLPTHSAALRIAAGVAEGAPPDRYLVGLGMLSLLAAAGEEEPITCLVDDAHLVDTESLEVLAFVARRLQAERVLLILSGRPDERMDVAAAGVPVLELGGLDTLMSARLLNRSAPALIDPLLATRIAEEVGGNPLALVELAHEFTLPQLTSSWVTPEPVPVGSRLESHYLQRITDLPPDSRLWLLVAAAESTGDIALISGAAAQLGIPSNASVAVEQAGLASVRDQVAFRHPLVRSVVYNAMPADDRQRVHDLLRVEADAVGRGDLAVWHAAAATTGSDEAVATRLERAADVAGERGGSASRARLLTRAAELTPEGPLRGARLLAAAESAAQAGAARLALTLIGRIDTRTLDPVSAGRVVQLETLVGLFIADRERILSGAADMLRAAELFSGAAPQLEQRALIRAFEVMLTAEWATQDVTLPQLGERLAAGVDVADGPMSIILRGLSAHILLPYQDAVPHMREALVTLAEMDDADVLESGSVAVALTMALWDERASVTLLERSLGVSRARGRLRDADTSLWLLGLIELVRGDPAASARYIEQIRELRRAIGYDAEQVVNAASLAWAGAANAHVELVADAARAVGFAGAWTIAMTGLSIRELADGHYRDAFERLRPMIERPFLQVTYQQLPEFVEAGVRSGNADRVRGSADTLAGFAAHAGTPWIRGLSARCAALLADDGHAEDLYVEAIAHLTESTVVADAGRAHLLYGEWLRRAKRRHDAREHLQRALLIFERCEAPAFAARARRELEATGLKTGADAPTSLHDLTPQESAVARLASTGHTNPEIGAALFISANTVDYHLRKVFRKLGVASRRQLSERFPRD
ncbi:helix-turn-helix transcriptional regulator [Microbacterium saccharophilum]|uniref:Helix-turn-helix transcriptional regulator n=1 Tax=Microbacterium saccharophilum TaxID=1213358 RepID=A0A5C8IAM4_9MICO|nr:helix-turn-helix transcriptional regulator [Microbacterium saccharophilum]